MQDITSDESLIKWRVANSNTERLEAKETELVKSIEGLTQDITDWNGAKLLLEHLKNYKLEKRKDFILGVINSALKDIFEADYRLDIQPRDTKGKSAASTQKYDIIFFQNDIEMARNNDLLTSNGGGVLSIASLFFKILIGYLYSKNKFYIFDEALSQVSPQFRGRLSRFLREFCEKYDFTLVVVSQTEELEEHAHLVYEVDSSLDADNIPVLDIVNVIGDIPTENYFYNVVKNFQSVVDATFIYKGFTIIRGPNNSGKSATLRAVDALIFNNFKIDGYPRKYNGPGVLTTEIKFGFQGRAGTIPKEIGLKYKGGKVMFVIEGEEYYGKSLAADKLKEAVEAIGFKYIDVKKMYKNFKGALKDQTERIAYTNQYDGLFLIGAKTSDSEKIFSFLFNTENIALAIAQAKETVLEFNKNHKAYQLELIGVQEELRKAKLNVDYYIKMYYYKILEEVQAVKSNLDKSRNTQDRIEKIILGIDSFVSTADNSIWLFENSMRLNELRNKVLHNNTQAELISKTIGVIEETNLIQSYFSLENANQKYKTKLDAMDQLIPRIQGIITYDDYISAGQRIIQTRETRESFHPAIQGLNEEYNLCECTECSGLGVQPS